MHHAAIQVCALGMQIDTQHTLTERNYQNQSAAFPTCTNNSGKWEERKGLMLWLVGQMCGCTASQASRGKATRAIYHAMRVAAVIHSSPLYVYSQRGYSQRGCPSYDICTCSPKQHFIAAAVLRTRSSHYSQSPMPAHSRRCRAAPLVGASS